MSFNAVEEARKTWNLGLVNKTSEELMIKQLVEMEKQDMEDILSLNIRGLGSRVKKMEIQEIVKKQNCDLCCIQEIKMRLGEKVTLDGCLNQLWVDLEGFYRYGMLGIFLALVRGT
ncbi:hypothetical protein ACS0TY_021011 [Phlomoides rotata]